MTPGVEKLISTSADNIMQICILAKSTSKTILSKRVVLSYDY